MSKRLVLVFTVLLVLGLVVTACAKATPTPAPAPAEKPTPTPKVEQPTPTPKPAAPAKEGLTPDDPLEMVFVPSGEAEVILSGGQKLDKLLAEKGVYTKSSVATSYAAAIEALCSGKADIVWLAPLSYVLAHDKCGAIPVFGAIRFGSATYKGQMIVNVESGIEKVEDVKGHKVAFTDPASTSGYLYPVALLLKNGVTLNDIEYTFAGGHTAAALAVYQGSVDAAFTYVDARNRLEEKFPDIKKKTKVIATTDDIPNDTISVRKDLDPDVLAAFKKAMKEVGESEEGKQVLNEIYEWDGLAETSDALFDPIRQVAVSLGIELQNWKGVSVPWKACQVTDVGGIDDRSFNATAWKGMEMAKKKLKVEVKYLESQQQTDYATNIQEFLNEGCDIIITVGFLLGDATKEFAQKYPDQKFAIVDFAYDPPLPNVLGLTFSTDEASFLAGYVAAGMSKTGKVGTFGGIKIPPVTIFMVGYEQGVKYYNKKHDTNVEVLGWETDLNKEGFGDGLFTGNFESTDDGRRFAESLMDEGADVIMPVAGPVGLGTAAAVEERGAMMVGVDTDWYISAPEFKQVYLTSVLKNMDVAVFEAVKAVVEGRFKGGTYVGTLANGGVGIAPFHDFEDKVPDDLKAELKEVRQGIIDGTVDTGWPLK